MTRLAWLRGTRNLVLSDVSPLEDHKVDTTAPMVQAALLDGRTVTLSLSELLNTAVPPTSAFTVRVAGGPGSNPASVSVSGNEVALTLASPPTGNPAVTVSYAKPSSNPIKDLSGRELESFTDYEAISPPTITVVLWTGLDPLEFPCWSTRASPSH